MSFLAFFLSEKRIVRGSNGCSPPLLPLLLGAVRQFDVVVPHLRGVITLDDYEDAQSEAWDIDGFSGSQVDELCSNFDEISSNFDEINSNFDGSELFEDDEDWDEFLHRAVPVGKSYSQVLRGG